MKKLVGYSEMKKQVGKIIYYVDDARRDYVVGASTDKEFIYGDLSKNISADSIGKTIEIQYEKGYNGKPIVCGVNIK